MAVTSVVGSSSKEMLEANLRWVSEMIRLVAGVGCRHQNRLISGPSESVIESIRSYRWLPDDRLRYTTGKFLPQFFFRSQVLPGIGFRGGSSGAGEDLVQRLERLRG